MKRNNRKGENYEKETRHFVFIGVARLHVRARGLRRRARRQNRIYLSRRGAHARNRREELGVRRQIRPHDRMVRRFVNVRVQRHQRECFYRRNLQTNRYKNQVHYARFRRRHDAELADHRRQTARSRVGSGERHDL